MATQHSTIEKLALNPALVAAELVTTHGNVPPRRELWLTFANEGVAATHYKLKVPVWEVKTSAV